MNSTESDFKWNRKALKNDEDGVGVAEYFLIVSLYNKLNLYELITDSIGTILAFSSSFFFFSCFFEISSNLKNASVVSSSVSFTSTRTQNSFCRISFRVPVRFARSPFMTMTSLPTCGMTVSRSSSWN